MKRIYATNQKDWENICKRNFFQAEKLTVKFLKDGIMLPPRVKKNTNLEYEGGVCDKNYNFVTGLKRHEPHKTLAIEVNSSYKPDKVVKREGNVIFGGCLAGRFGHFVIEGLGRLWFVLQKYEYKKYKIAFLPYSDREEPWFKDFFKLLGIDSSRIVMIKEATQFSEIIIPEESVHSWHCYTKEFMIPYQTICENLPRMISCKLYLTKKTWNRGAQLCNEEYFEEFFRKKGFICIEPENYTVEEQISLLHNATEVVTTLGSLSHLALFCKPKTKFVILTRVNDDVLKPQALVNQATDIDWYIVDVAKNYLYANRVVGINYIGPTPYFQDFIKDYYNEDISLDEDNPTGQYIKRWCEHYASLGNFRRISGLKSIDYLKRMYQISCGKTLDVSKLIKEEKKEKEQMDILKWQIKELASENSSLNDSFISIEVHLSNVGWIPHVNEGVPAGDGKNFIEAVRIKNESESDVNVIYSTYDSMDGWSDEVSNGMMSGSTGKSRHLSGIKIRLDELGEKYYSLQYKCMYSNEGWGDWIDGGDEDYREREFLMGIQVKIIRI